MHRPHQTTKCLALLMNFVGPANAIGKLQEVVPHGPLQENHEILAEEVSDQGVVKHGGRQHERHVEPCLTKCMVEHLLRFNARGANDQGGHRIELAVLLVEYPAVALYKTCGRCELNL